jgi:MATE family multidrug resistance protein
MGTAQYVSTFVAQYYGSGRHDRIGPSVWQGVYVALIGAGVLAAMIPLARPIFSAVGHDPRVVDLETVYFRILCLGAFPLIAANAFAGFFSGRGRSWPVMWVNVTATAVNLVLDYAMIFGRWGFPEMGMAGAGWATVIGQAVALTLFVALMIARDNNRTYRSVSGWRLDKELFLRLLRFGLPAGVQFFFDIFSFTIFVLFVGRLGTISLAASNIALNINMLAFMPMIGCSMAISILVGQYLGRDRPETARRSVWSGFHLVFGYMAVLSALYVLVPRVLIAPFGAKSTAAEFAAIEAATVVLLRFAAAFGLADAFNLVFDGALKGAGDTRFVMFTFIVTSVALLVIPSYVVIVTLDLGLYAAWGVITVYVAALAVVFFWRFQGGRWMSMRVIETETSN